MRLLNLLIVDDDPSLVSAARALLLQRNCHIEAAFSGLDAVSRVRAGGIDAVLLDVWMPEINGLSALEEFARVPAPPRVVLMSGNVEDRVEKAVAEGKALACLQKPVDFELAFTLLEGHAPERPLQLSPALSTSELIALASQAIGRGVVFLDHMPQLPPGSPVALSLSLTSGPLQLLGVADTGVKAGKRGLGLRLAQLTGAQEQALQSIGSAVPTEARSPSAAPTEDRAVALYRRGLERLESGRYDTALLDFRAAQELNTSDPLIAAAALRAGELAGMEKARGLFRQATSREEAEPREALKLLEDAIRLDPSRAAYHREAARLYLQSGEMTHAEECLSAAVHLAPSDPAPRLHLAQLLDRAGRPKEALWACEAALHLFPGDKELQKLQTKLQRKTGGS